MPMSAKDWYICIGTETLGPFKTDVLSLMLKQNRIQFADFAWSSTLGNSRWVRLYQLDEFSRSMPPYPDVDVPDGDKKTEPKTEPKKELKKELKKEPPVCQQFPKIRRFERVKVNAVAEVQGIGEFKILNIGEGGIYVKSGSPPQLGTDLKLKLTSKAFPKALEMTGVVIRHGISTEEPGFGIEFTRVNPAHKRIICEYVCECLKEKSGGK